MKYDEIFEMLTDIDSDIFNKWLDMQSNTPEKLELEKAHEAIKTALLAFTNIMEKQERF